MEKLSSTSALVILMAGRESYASAAAQRYLRALDLSEGHDLHRATRLASPLADECLKNRKFGVPWLLERAMRSHRPPQQVVLAGAGLDAMGIEFLSRFPALRIFELDSENMDRKAQLLAACGISGITCIEADLTRPGASRAALAAGGWRAQDATLLLLEGISYYLPRPALESLVRGLDPAFTIFEFLKPAHTLKAAAARHAEAIFGTLVEACALPPMTRYTLEEIEASLGLPVLAHCPMAVLEEKRTGRRRHFPDARSSWIEIALLGQAARRRGRVDYG